MTFACVPALRAEPEVAKEWEPRVLGTGTTRAPPRGGKRAATSAWP